jgi:hypothetical protein
MGDAGGTFHDPVPPVWQLPAQHQPQHAAAPVVPTAHVKPSPTNTAVALPSAGVSVRPGAA